MPASHNLHGSVPTPLNRYPRITLRCGQCSNEFCISVMRFAQEEAVLCQVCGSEFPKDLGKQFADSLESLFQVKSELEKRKNKFNISFVYKSTFKQPPGPYPFNEQDFEAPHSGVASHNAVASQNQGSQNQGHHNPE
jgi:hypothetical protein